jgi:hypothetical protein
MCRRCLTTSVLRSGSVRFFAPKTRNCGLQPVQDRPRYCEDRTGPPWTGLLQSTQPKKTGSDWFFGVNFVVPIKIIFISTIITLKIKRVIEHSRTCKYPSFDQISRDLMNIDRAMTKTECHLLKTQAKSNVTTIKCVMHIYIDG